MWFKYSVTLVYNTDGKVITQLYGEGISLLAAVKDAASKLAKIVGRDVDGDWYYVDGAKLVEKRVK